MPRAVSAAPSSVLAPPSVPTLSGVLVSPSVLALGPVRPAAGSATYVVSPGLMAAMAREPLRIPDLPPSNDEISAFLVV